MRLIFREANVIRLLSAEETVAQVEGLAEVLLDAVAGGASVSFMADFSHADAVAYFRGIASEVAAGRRLLLAAGEVSPPAGSARIDGTAQLILETPPNQPHRAELAKMLVHRRARRRGLGRALFDEVCAAARRRGRTLLTFDTISGAEGEKLYLACGCVKAGEIPGYALMPDGRPAPTSVFYKNLV